MSLLESLLVAIIEGVTEYLPISSTAHMIFLSSLLKIQDSDFTKLFQISIQLGAIAAVVVLYWKKFFDLTKLNFYYRLIVAVIPALILGKLLDDKIDVILEKPIPIAVVLILGGVVFLFIEKKFSKPTIQHEEQITYKKAFWIGVWQCLALMPGTSRSAASILGGMQQGLDRKTSTEFSFFLAVPTMAAATLYTIFIKTFEEGIDEVRGYELFYQGNNFIVFLIGNVVAFIVAIIALKSFVKIIKKYGFRPWGFYRIAIGVLLLGYFIFLG